MTRRGAFYLWPGCLGGLTALGLDTVLMSPRFLSPWACAVLALGIGVPTFHLVQHHPVGSRRCLRGIFWGALALTVVGGLEGTAWSHWREQQALAALPATSPENPLAPESARRSVAGPTYATDPHE